MIPIDKIENTETCFVQLWLQLELTRQELQERYKRFCIRNLLKSWFGSRATDDFIWDEKAKATLDDFDDEDFSDDDYME